MSLEAPLSRVRAKVASGAPPQVLRIAASANRGRAADTDPWLAERAVQGILDALLPDPGEREMSLLRFDGAARDFRLDAPLDEMRSASFFGAGRVALVRRWSGSGREAAKTLQPLLERATWAPGNAMILWSVRSLPAAIERALAADPEVEAFDASSPRPFEVSGFVAGMGRERGVVFEPGAAELLVDLTGPILSLLWTEVCKLSDYVGERRSVSRRDVAEACSETREHDVFALVDAIALRDARRALGELERLLDGRTEPLQMVALLAHQFRRLLVLRDGMDRRLPPAEVAKAARVPDWLMRKLQPAARRCPTHRARRCLAALRQADRDLKTLRTPSRLVFETAVLHLVE